MHPKVSSNAAMGVPGNSTTNFNSSPGGCTSLIVISPLKCGQTRRVRCALLPPYLLGASASPSHASQSEQYRISLRTAHLVDEFQLLAGRMHQLNSHIALE